MTDSERDGRLSAAGGAAQASPRRGVDTIDAGAEVPVTSAVTQPSKVIRIAAMAEQLLAEVHAAPLDRAGQLRLREIHASSLRELGEGLSPDLRAELDRITLPLDEQAVPSDSELRVAQAQLVGWLEGLFHGVQATVFAEQVGAQVQLQRMRQQAAAEAAGATPGSESNAYL